MDNIRKQKEELDRKYKLLEDIEKLEMIIKHIRKNNRKTRLAQWFENLFDELSIHESHYTNREISVDDECLQAMIDVKQKQLKEMCDNE